MVPCTRSTSSETRSAGGSSSCSPTASAARARSARWSQREFGISQPAVSQHLRVLREAGFATVRPEGTRRLYAVDPGSAAGRRCVVRPVPPVLAAAPRRPRHRARPRATCAAAGGREDRDRPDDGCRGRAHAPRGSARRASGAWRGVGTAPRRRGRRHRRHPETTEENPDGRCQRADRGRRTRRRDDGAPRPGRARAAARAGVPRDDRRHVERRHDGAASRAGSCRSAATSGSAAAISSRATPVAWCGNAARPRTAPRAITRRGSSAAT